MVTSKCGICGSDANLLFERHVGYMAPSAFDIYDCSNCETRFVAPMIVDSSIYDRIYEHANEVPGYGRYEMYRHHLRDTSDPLKYLAMHEDVYWSVREVLQKDVAKPTTKARILEIGSGLGYLTYALRKAGYDCIGIDISQRAVEVACREFGNYYFETDIMQMSIAEDETFDFVIATELIEHISNPKALLGRVHDILKPGGRLILTTPNKDLYSDRFIWHTDLPPVHLWWFSKNSMRNLAWSIGMSVWFVDFSKFYGLHRMMGFRSTKPQTFDEGGRIIFSDSLFNMFMRRLLVNMPRLFKIIAKNFICIRVLGKLRNSVFRDSLSLCVVMKKSNG